MEKIKEYMLRRNKSSHVLMLIAGGYLLYLVYDMFKLSDFPEDSSMVFFYIAAVVFVLFGLTFVAFSGYALAKGYFRENVVTDVEEDLEDQDPDNEFEDARPEDEEELPCQEAGELPDENKHSDD